MLKLSKLIERTSPNTEARRDNMANPPMRKEIFGKSFVGIREGINKKLRV